MLLLQRKILRLFHLTESEQRGLVPLDMDYFSTPLNKPELELEKSRG